MLPHQINIFQINNQLIPMNVCEFRLFVLIFHALYNFQINKLIPMSICEFRLFVSIFSCLVQVEFILVEQISIKLLNNFYYFLHLCGPTKK